MGRRELFSNWAAITFRTAGNLGYSKSSPSAPEHWMIQYKFTRYKAALPHDVQMYGLSDYLKVENALSELPDKHRLVLSLDQGIIRPNNIDFRTARKRAEYLGITESAYHGILKRIVSKAT